MIAAPAAVVLAAGGSTRLGHPKQLLTRDGETLVHRTARLAMESGAARVHVVCGAQAAAIRKALDGLPVECIDNPHWQEGMAGSLRAAAATLSPYPVPALVLACDQPALEAAHLAALLRAARDASSGCAATRHGERLGIPAVLSPEVLRTAGGLRGDRGFRDALNAVPREAIGVCDAGDLALDIDTPEDMALAVARGWLDPV